MKRRIVEACERWCTRFHWLFHRRPWLWLPIPVCPLAVLSDKLDERWHTGVWQPPPSTSNPVSVSFVPPHRRCEYCGSATTQRYCDDDCRLADKTGTGPKACAYLAGREGFCTWHNRPVEECEAAP